MQFAKSFSTFYVWKGGLRKGCSNSAVGNGHLWGAHSLKNHWEGTPVCPANSTLRIVFSERTG